MARNVSRDFAELVERERARVAGEPPAGTISRSWAQLLGDVLGPEKLGELNELKAANRRALKRLNRSHTERRLAQRVVARLKREGVLMGPEREAALTRLAESKMAYANAQAETRLLTRRIEALVEPAVHQLRQQQSRTYRWPLGP